MQKSKVNLVILNEKSYQRLYFDTPKYLRINFHKSFSTTKLV